MTNEATPVVAGAEAQPQADANPNSIESIVDNAVIESNTKPDDIAKPEDDQPKELNAADELEKLRRAKARDDRKIGKLTAIKYQLQKEADEAKVQLSKYQTSRQGTDLSPEKTGIPTKLDSNKFSNFADFLEARTEEIADYKIEAKLLERDGKQTQAISEAKDQEWLLDRSMVVDKQADEFAKEVPEIVDIFNRNAKTIKEYPQELKKALLAADNAPLALYNLDKEGLLEELADMSLEDAKVEIRLAQMKPIVKPKTNAPKPMPAARGAVAGSKRLEDMDGDEIRQFMRAK